MFLCRGLQSNTTITTSAFYNSEATKKKHICYQICNPGIEMIFSVALTLCLCHGIKRGIECRLFKKILILWRPYVFECFQQSQQNTQTVVQIFWQCIVKIPTCSWDFFHLGYPGRSCLWTQWSFDTCSPLGRCHPLQPTAESKHAVHCC